ncbi:hypothetical protein CPC08DRAFT_279667 [Agrocybe pediades]|nr:hypothetical protein CPC08DRAFT_279667 [Agrocybe pediades]
MALSPFFPLFLLFLLVHAQNISTTTPVPPLQWINLSPFLQGSSHPPPLRDASVGYDETSRSLIIFGGLSSSGVPQSQTYLLNLDTLTWSTPSPPPNLQRSPPSRSAALSGVDFAASNRHGFVVIGGMGVDGNALSDVWEYDFNNQFWSPVQISPGGPSARWGASGGIDIRTPFHQDPIVPGPNNTILLSGGFNGKTANPLSDTWQLELSGTLSSNMPDSVNGSWEHLSIHTLPARINQASTVISTNIITSGGCDASSSSSAINVTCARQDSFIVDTDALTAISPLSCPAPRVAPVLIPNLNSFSTSFKSQSFLLLGNFDQSLWKDDNALAHGEVAILDINTATWTRILPTGDPDSSGTQHFPTAREGASGVSFTEALVGNSRNTSSDTIIFGGQDANGNFLSDVWLLRAYSGVITPSSPTWTGFGDGKLKTGVNADGSGVRVQYITECASLIPQGSNEPPTSGNNSSTNSGTGNGQGNSSGDGNTQPTAIQEVHRFNTSLTHKLFAPLSTVLLFPAILFFRWTQVSIQGRRLLHHHILLVSLSALLGLAAYVLGIVGLVLSFTTISSNTPSAGHVHLKTGHGIAGLVFFLCLYALVPLLYLFSFCFGFLGRQDDAKSQKTDGGKSASVDTNEKLDPGTPLPRSYTPSMQNVSPPASPRSRTLSWDASYMLRPSQDGAGSPSVESGSPTPHKGFEVLGRPARTRTRNLSDGGVPYALPTSRSLGEIDWLLRRRSLNAFGELDYAITQSHNANTNSVASASNQSPAVFVPIIQYPPPHAIASHFLLQISLLGLAGVSLAQLWMRAPRYLFAIFLVWVVGYCILMVVLSWYRRPASSLLTVFLWNLSGRALPSMPVEPLPDRPPTVQGPYTHHRPPHQVVPPHLDETYSQTRALSDTDDNDDDDIDEDTRQRQIEEEMERREVSIVTVPRRKLLVTNPS